MPVAAIGLAVTAASTVLQVSQANRANRARREGQRIQNANETLRNRSARRRAAKELRIRRASVEQSSTNSGVSGSSGELGAIAAMQSSFGSTVADQSANITAIRGISNQNQRAADAVSKGKTISAFESLVTEGLDLFEE